MGRYLIISLLAVGLGIESVCLYGISNEKNVWEKDARENGMELQHCSMQRNELSDANYVLTEKVKYAESQEEYVIGRGQDLIRRLLQTTDIAESQMRCNNNGVSVENCMQGLDVKDFLDKNREAKF